MDSSTISLAADRFARFEAIKWWDQSRLRSARVLVAGAGALGNEVIKNLALLGVGRLVIVDMDRIETSNLCRSVLFREGDEGKSKALAAAAAARQLYPAIEVEPIHGNLMSDVGLGVMRWADVVVGALDNREARVWINSACARTGKPWIDGGIDILNGIVRGFAPPQSACYECTMGEADWALLNKRRSCSLLARKAFAEGGAPTTPTTASVIGAIQAQEVVKQLHGLDCLRGAAFVFEGLKHNSFQVTYPISPDCLWHEPPAAIESHSEWSGNAPLRAIWDWGRERMGTVDAIDLSRELVESLSCPQCQKIEQIMLPIERVSDQAAVCPTCGTDRSPQFVHSLGADSPLLDRNSRQLGLPAWDVLYIRGGDSMTGIELAGDRPAGAFWQ